MDIFSEKYSDKDVFPFPDRNITPSQKSTREYTKKVGEAIYSRYQKNKTAASSASTSYFKQLRQYGVGEQSEDMYKRYLSGVVQSDTSAPITAIDGSWTENKTQERRGWMNVLWDILSPAQMIKKMIHGLFDDIDFDIIADAVDADSGAEEENEKWKLWVTTKSPFAQRLLAAKALSGIQLEQPDFIPENIEELEMYREAGRFKTAYAMEMEKLIRHIADISEWEDLKAKVLDDIIDLHRAFVKGDYDSDLKKIVWRYVDPEDLVVQYSKYNDFRDSTFAGEFHEIKISDLRKKLMEEGYDEDTIKTIVKTYAGKYGNPSEDAQYSERYDGVYRYDNFTIVVFSYEWIDSDVEKKIRFTNKYGKIRTLPYEEGQKLGKREELVQTTKQFLYKGNWIIGTDYTYDYGRVYYQPRPRPNKVELTYKGFVIPGPSLTAQLKPIYDDIQIGWLQYQNSRSQLFHAGYAVDFRMLNNISDGKKKMDPLEVLQMWKETGILLFMSVGVGQYYKGGATIPVHRIEGGMGQAIDDAVRRIQMAFMVIERITGFSPVALGATPNPEAPVTTTERSLQATHNSMKPMIRGIFDIKNMLAKSTSPRIQQILRYDREAEKEFIKVIGEGGVQAIKIAQDTAAELGIKLQARPSAQEKAALLQAAQAALQPGRDGLRGISFDDYTYIIERLNANGNIKEIRLYLSQAKRRAEKKSFQERQALIKQQTDGNLQAVQAKTQADAAMKNMDIRGQIAVDNNKAFHDMKLKMADINGKYMNQLESEAVKQMSDVST